MKITIIGAGNMGGSIARGLAKGSLIKEENITVTARSEQTLYALRLTNPAFKVTTENTEAVKDADIIIFAVKPWILEPVISQIRSHIDLERQLIISVVAGVSFQDLEQMFTQSINGSTVMFRVIPNTAIAIRQSMTLIASHNALLEQERLIKSIFDELGESILVEEQLMAAGTALCSCGTAFAMKYVKASIDAGVELGFYPKDAKMMIEQTVRGAIELLYKNGMMPDEEIYKVTTPGGITIKGLNEMEAQGFSSAIIKGLKVAAGK